MAIDQRVLRRYEVYDEDGRLWRKGRGDLIRLRTWDLFRRLLPASGGRVLDVGGGTGTHAAHLAGLGFDVVLLDPVFGHVSRAAARSRSQPEAPFRSLVGEARHLPAGDASVNVVLMMGPLYHLIDPADRAAALAEAMRVLPPGGLILAETITRHSWVLAAAIQEDLDLPGVWQHFDQNIQSGLSQNPAMMNDGDFWAYLHRPDELGRELRDAGFADVDLVGVESFGWLLGDLERRMEDPKSLLRALRLTEREPSMIGVSGHVIGVGRRPTDVLASVVPSRRDLRPD